ARPVSSLVADHAGWHSMFGAASLVVLALAFVLRRRLPLRQPSSPLSYWSLIGSLRHLFATTPVLRR
ncbi:MAG TPA: MFS transporter, partial [Massilia sp.]|nr:MFS transporter [Massilia sp.]